MSGWKGMELLPKDGVGGREREGDEEWVQRGGKFRQNGLNHIIVFFFFRVKAIVQVWLLVWELNMKTYLKWRYSFADWKTAKNEKPIYYGFLISFTIIAIFPCVSKAYGSQWSYKLSLQVEKYFDSLNYTLNIMNLTYIYFGEMCSSVSCGFPSNVGKCGSDLTFELPKFSPGIQFWNEKCRANLIIM